MSFQIHRAEPLTPGAANVFATATIPIDPEDIIKQVANNTWVCRENMMVFVTNGDMFANFHSFPEFVTEYFSEEQRFKLAEVISDKIHYLDWIRQEIM